MRWTDWTPSIFLIAGRKTWSDCWTAAKDFLSSSGDHFRRHSLAMVSNSTPSVILILSANCLVTWTRPEFRPRDKNAEAVARNMTTKVRLTNILVAKAYVLCWKRDSNLQPSIPRLAKWMLWAVSKAKNLWLICLRCWKRSSSITVYRIEPPAEAPRGGLGAAPSAGQTRQRSFNWYSVRGGDEENTSSAKVAGPHGGPHETREREHTARILDLKTSNEYSHEHSAVSSNTMHMLYR